MSIKNYFLTFSSILILVSCGGGGGGGSTSDSGSGGYGSGSSNSAPAITNTSLGISVVENQTSAFTVTASDSDNDSLTYTILNNDAGLFTISSSSGVVTFSTAPDFEDPTDANEDNVYSLTASVSDGTLSDSKDFTVTVTNDTSDDEVASAWDGTLEKNNSYAPYDKHATSYALILAGLSDVTDEFVINVANITNKILASNSSTNSTNRNAVSYTHLTLPTILRV